jgi:hypothetical protein
MKRVATDDLFNDETKKRKTLLIRKYMKLAEPYCAFECHLKPYFSSKMTIQVKQENEEKPYFTSQMKIQVKQENEEKQEYMESYLATALSMKAAEDIRFPGFRTMQIIADDFGEFYDFNYEVIESKKLNQLLERLNYLEHREDTIFKGMENPEAFSENVDKIVELNKEMEEFHNTCLLIN